MEWQLINTGLASGEFNMNYDIELAHQLMKNEIPQTVRVYGWKPWAVSLGYNQSESDIDIEKCREFGFDIVRRPTGGRAILHANEVTYSVVMYAFGRGITQIYSTISKALVQGLQTICPKVSYETAQPNFRQLYRQQESIPCFSSSARYEVQINGKKLVGSAQRRFSSPDSDEVVLQHGSILLGSEHILLADVLNITDEQIRQKIRRDFEEKTISLSAALGRSVSYHEVISAVKKGFESFVDFIPSSESRYEYTNI
jgi:lipoate-protein ligase A